jgi:hypothetical protein
MLSVRYGRVFNKLTTELTNRVIAVAAAGNIRASS